jgi:hypothetical protein
MYLEVIEGTRNIKYIKYKDKVNRYFVWKLIRSIFIDKFRRTYGRSVNKQSTSYWLDMKENFPQEFYRMARKERKDTDKEGKPVTFLKDTRPPYEGASLFLLPNENYPDIRDISMIRFRSDKESIKTCPLIEDLDLSYRAHKEYDSEEEEAFSFILDKIERITSSWKVYDKQLFDLYFIQGQSLRQISSGAGIGLNSIHNSVKSYRQILKNELSGDLAYYFEHYDKI